MVCAGLANAGDLVLTLTGIASDRGNIRIALYDNEKRWSNDVEARETLESCQCVLSKKRTEKGKAFAEFKGKAGAYPIVIPAKDHLKGVMTIMITGLKPGNYAVSLFHDMNSDKKMNMKSLLLVAERPAEPFGLSKDFNPLKSLRAPKFNDCVFAVGAGQTRQTILLR